MLSRRGFLRRLAGAAVLAASSCLPLGQVALEGGVGEARDCLVEWFEARYLQTVLDHYALKVDLDQVDDWHTAMRKSLDGSRLS